MNKYEFLDACEEYTGKTQYINNENFAVVEYVYNWHPSISESHGKDQIVMLYCTFGMNIIKDMYPRAEKNANSCWRIPKSESKSRRNRKQYKK